jgi:hypothetical protein
MNTVHPKTGSRSWRTYVRFSMRGLLVLILALGVGLGWLVHRAQVQRDLVNAIQRAGGQIWYDWQFKDGRIVSNGVPPGLKWLVEVLGVDYFADVTVINESQGIADKELAQIGSLSKLERLNLNGSTVTDAVLADLSGMTNLEFLGLNETAVSDAGMARLKRLTKLKTLMLDKTKVIDTGLNELDGLTNLDGLNLCGTAVGDSGLGVVKGMTNLRILSLRTAPKSPMPA